MTLRGWECSQLSVSNSNQKLKDQHDNPISKVLGIQWHKSEDTLSCVVPEQEASKIVTKREILSFVSKIFDPIGFVSPALLPPKLILQGTWSAKQGWDERLPEEAVIKFEKWYKELQCVQSIKIKRNIAGDQNLRKTM